MITDSQATPESWNSEIAKTEDDIKITEEGEKYLHIIATDNAGNVSEDRILGVYQIDHSGPTININGDFDTTTTTSVIATIDIEDKLSGVKTSTINGETLTSNTVEILKNGTYTINTEDNIGNTSTKTIEVDNIYRTCNAGLEHPIYPSELDSCPICDKIQGLTVQKNEYTYDATAKGVEYSNPQSAEIVEYYNKSLTKPTDAGEYDYDLKVKVDGKEYNTGCTGKLIINQKNITIEEITAKNRQYDGTNVVELEGGKLIGVEASDTIGFNLPKTGTIENINIGTYNVAIEEIKLTGQEAGNYVLTQPDIEDVTVDIVKRIITISDIDAIDRLYDKTNIVKIKGGTLNNVIETDDIIPVIPEEGTIENRDIGTWNVTIEPIVLEGEDSPNYELVQPTPEEIQVTISKPEQPNLHIESFIKRINDEELEDDFKEEIVEQNKENTIEQDGEDKTNEDLEETEETNENSDNTEENADDENATQEEVNNMLEQKDIEVKYYTPICEKDIRYGDEIELKIRIYNQGIGNGYAKQVTDIIPEGLEFIENNNTNNENGWELQKDGTIKTNKLDFTEEAEQEIQGLQEEKIDFKELSLVLKVTQVEMLDNPLINTIKVEQADIRNETIPLELNTDNSLEIKIAYTDMQINETISEIDSIYGKNTKEHKISEENNKFAKCEIRRQEVKNSKVKVVYDITVTNKGNTKGEVQKVVTNIPEGFSIQNNDEWTMQNSNEAWSTSFGEIEPEKTVTKQLILTANANAVLGSNSSEVFIDSKEDIDQRILQEDTKEINVDNLKNTNNYGNADTLLSVSTGGATNTVFIIIMLGILSIIAVLISWINKKF